MFTIKIDMKIDIPYWCQTNLKFPPKNRRKPRAFSRHPTIRAFQLPLCQSSNSAAHLTPSLPARQPYTLGRAGSASQAAMVGIRAQENTNFSGHPCIWVVKNVANPDVSLRSSFKASYTQVKYIELLSPQWKHSKQPHRIVLLSCSSSNQKDW